MSTLPESVLAKLADIELPAEAGWWPPAPGWWLLTLILLLAIASCLLWAWVHRRRRRYLREALAELAGLADTANAGPVWYGDLNRLLKRVARVRYPEARTDHLTGQYWSQFLADTSSQPANACRLLVQGAVQPGAGLPPDQAVKLVRAWIREQS